MAEKTDPLLLVIDDDKAIGQSLVLHFRYRGFRVEAASNGHEGLRRLAAGDVDLVLCDIGMPDLTGHEVVQRARAQAEEHGQQPPEIVIMTANATLDHALRALKEGATQFVTKPLSMPFLEVVVQHALSLRELRQRARRLEQEQRHLLLRALSDVTAPIGLVGALEAVLHALERLLRPRRAAVWLCQAPTRELRPMVLEPHDATLPELHGSLAEQAREARIPVAQADGDTWYSAAPVILHERVEGVVTAELTADGVGQDTVLALLTDLAQFAGNAILKERLFADLEASSMKISSLFEVGLAMSSEVSLQRLFEVIVESASRISGADRCSLMLLDTDQQTLRIRAARGVEADVVAKAESHLGEGIAGSVAASGKPLLVADIEHDAAYARANSYHYNSHSLVSVPIRVHDQVVGVLNVNNKHDGTVFTENDLNLLTLLASQAAVAIDNARRYQDLSQKAITDGLTGVYLRRYFDECLDHAWRASRATGHPFSVLMADIDHFKHVNDTYGHPVGDEALRAVAAVLREMVRDDDLVARYGGEEFGLILTRAAHGAAVRVAERIRSRIQREKITAGGHTFKLTISIGVATAREETPAAADLVVEADAALYQAKEAGRNRVVSAEGLEP